MKTKNKVLALLEIAIVLCSLFLVALPAIAADMQGVSASTITSASKDDYVLGVYGNANEDDTIDMRDLTYVKLIFFGKKPETELADAKYDGKINPLDFIQIKLIIVGKEKELTVVDSRGEAVTVKKPVKRIIPLADHYADAIRVLGAENDVVGVGSGIAKEEVLLPVMSKLPVIGGSIWGAPGPDIEAILALDPELIITYGKYPKPELLEDKLIGTGIVVVRLELKDPKVIVEDVKKLGYIFDKRERSEEFIDWYEGYMDTFRDRTEALSEDGKPRVYIEMYPRPDRWKYKTWGKGSSADQDCMIAGGINIAGDLEGHPMVDAEWVIEQNPEMIVGIVTSIIPSGYGVDDTTGVEATRLYALNIPELQNIDAVKDEQIYLIASDVRCGIQKVIGIAYMARIFHPELFGDLDPQAIHQEYLAEFQRIDYDITEHGVFVYPPLED